VALTELRKMDGKLIEGPVSNSRKTRGFNVEKKNNNEGFFRIFAKTQGFILYLPNFLIQTTTDYLSHSLLSLKIIFQYIFCCES
jgi:hypothetical protein